MPKRLEVELSEKEQKRLEQARRTHPKAYIRARAAAILKISKGLSAREVALHRLLYPRKPDTVAGWVHDYIEGGFDALFISPGRGRKPASPP